MTKEDFKEYYKQERVTSSYTNQRLSTEYRRQKRMEELDIFLELLNKKEGEKVLEIGCSDGWLTQRLGKVTAIDTSKKMLEITKTKNPEANIIEADMFKLPFKDKSFDKVVTMRVWNHLNEKDLRKALREARRVLKDNGYLVFDMEEKNWLRRFVHFFYKRIFKITGFKIYQYSIIKMMDITFEEGFDTDLKQELNHRIGKQIIWRIKKKNILSV